MAENSKLNPDNKRFFDRLPANQRSTVSNLFLDPIRSGVGDAIAVVKEVYAEAKRRRDEAHYPNPERQEKAALLMCLLKQHYDEAVALAEYYIAYESLPRSERERIKMTTSLNAVKDSMAGKPTTDKQKELLGILGFTGAFPTDRKEASEIIDRLLNTTNHDLANNSVSEGGGN